MDITLEEAIKDVKIAFQQVEFCLKNHAYWERTCNSADHFVTDMTVTLPEGDLHFPTDRFTDKQNILNAAEISIVVAYGCTALALDQAFETAGYKVKPKSNDSFDQLRCVIYLIRCAYAHRMACPYWDVRKDKRRIYEIDLKGRKIEIDATKLDKEPFDFPQVGGHKTWHDIKDMVLETLVTQQGGEPER